MKRLLPRAALALLLAPALRADTILLVSGETIADVTVTDETLAEVSFERAGKAETVAAENVLDVRFQKVPDPIDEARSAYAEDDLAGAVELLDAFVAENQGRNRRLPKWALPYAAWRALEVRRELADAAGTIAGADAFLAAFPESRHVPAVLQAKAEAQRAAGKAGEADQTLTALDELARARGLGRWELLARLDRLAASDLKGDEKRKQLQNLAATATKHADVRALAKVAEAQTYLAEASRVSLEDAQKLRTTARPLFQQVVDEPRAGARALAGAHVGLAECLFYEGAATNEKETLLDAAEHALRVAVSYRQESAVLPRALFLAMRSFDVLKDRGRKAEILQELRTRFPGSGWTAEAEKYK